jgi:hypothetical protein
VVKELKPDLEREKRIETEVVVDSCGEDEPHLHRETRSVPSASPG